MGAGLAALGADEVDPGRVQGHGLVDGGGRADEQRARFVEGLGRRCRKQAEREAGDRHPLVDEDGHLGVEVLRPGAASGGPGGQVQCHPVRLEHGQRRVDLGGGRVDRCGDEKVHGKGFRGCLPHGPDVGPQPVRRQVTPGQRPQPPGLAHGGDKSRRARPTPHRRPHDRHPDPQPPGRLGVPTPVVRHNPSRFAEVLRLTPPDGPRAIERATGARDRLRSGRIHGRERSATATGCADHRPRPLDVAAPVR